MGWCVPAAAAVVKMTVAPGSDMTDEPRGRAGLPSPPAGGAGPVCRARSGEVPRGVGYGRACSCVESSRGPPSIVDPFAVYGRFIVAWVSNLLISFVYAVNNR